MGLKLDELGPDIGDQACGPGHGIRITGSVTASHQHERGLDRSSVRWLGIIPDHAERPRWTGSGLWPSPFGQTREPFGPPQGQPTLRRRSGCKHLWTQAKGQQSGMVAVSKTQNSRWDYPSGCSAPHREFSGGAEMSQVAMSEAQHVEPCNVFGTTRQTVQER